jgi:drug/metabolite transporter (DMT)-like permease
MYATGIALGVTAGIAHNVGLLLQKRAVNQLKVRPRRGGFFSRLLARPLWWVGLLIQTFVGAVCLLLAQLFVGPALLPGLMASGLIVLAVGSHLIVRERLRPAEIVGVVLMIVAVTLLGLSRLSIEIRNWNLLDRGFLLRSAVFTGTVLVLVAALEIAQYVLARREAHRHRGLLLALSSGGLLSLSNFWTSPFMALVVKLLHRELTPGTRLLLGVLSVLLLAVNLLGIGRMQTAFRVSRASQAVPFQQIPLQVAPPLVYLVVFRLTAPSAFALPFLATGVVLIIACSFLLAGGRTQVELIH